MYSGDLVLDDGVRSAGWTGLSIFVNSGTAAPTLVHDFILECAGQQPVYTLEHYRKLLRIHNVSALGALGVYCRSHLCFILKDHVSRRDLGVATRACTESWWVRRGQGLITRLVGEECV